MECGHLCYLTLPSDESDVQSSLGTVTLRVSIHRARPYHVHGVCSELREFPEIAQKKDLSTRSLESIWETK